MSALTVVLHELINAAHGHGMPAARAEELHGLADTVETVAEDAGEVATVVSEVTEVTDPAKAPKNAGA